jgi:putative ABC transport system permease protein
VKAVIPVELSLATYQNPNQKVGMVAIRPDENWLSAFTFTIASDAVAAFRKTRTGAIIKVQLAKKYGWKVGDHIPLMSTTAQMNGSTDWAFDVVGTYTDSDIGASGDALLINYAYFDEARLAGKGTVKHFNVAVIDPKLAVTVADAIDRRFANSSNETRTESLRELAQSQLQSIGDLNFLIRAIVSAVLVALLFATATMMMQSTRERTPELAVLKTLGFTDRAVFLLHTRRGHGGLHRSRGVRAGAGNVRLPVGLKDRTRAVDAPDRGRGGPGMCHAGRSDQRLRSRLSRPQN